MIKVLLTLKIILLKIIKLNLAFLKNQTSGYPDFVDKFEKNFAKFIGVEYGITFCNGTSSIEAALYALNFSNNDEILVTSSNFHASIGPIKNLHYKPVFVDIDKDTLTIDLADLKNKITSKSKGLIIVHPWGYPCNMEQVCKIVKENNLRLIEDCSHAHGAMYSNKKIGSFSDISCFSLQGAKSVKAGEGGIALTNNRDFFLRMSAYGHFNRHEADLNQNKDLKKFSKTGISKKLRAHPLGVALANVDLENLNILNKYKNEIYNKIDKILVNYDSINTMKLNNNAIRGGFFGGYPVILKNINKIEKYKEIFKKYKINLDPYHWLLHHKMNIFDNEEVELPISEDIINKFYLLRMPFFLNFNYKNLKKCLNECEEIDKIN